MEHFLVQLFIFLAAAVIAIPIAKMLGLGSVLGYLLAGIVIGPFGISLIDHIEDVMHFTEFGVVMMLFLVGLELKPSMLWKMKTPILGMGSAQVLGTALVLCAVGLAYLPWQQALAVALIIALSSTAIVLQTLRENNLMKTSGGQSIFSVLLFQDLAVIPMFALMPFLSTLELQHDDHHGSHLVDISSLPGYLQTLIILGSIASIFLLGKYASRPIFRTIAKTKVREVFIAAALALVVGISLLMTVVGLSPALGAFLAGVVLADSEYRHELESDLEPFKGLLLGVFFITIGASLNFTLIGEKLGLIASLTAGIIIIKWGVLFSVASLFKMKGKERSLLAIALAQGGEFAFVFFQFSKNEGILDSPTIDPLISAVAISMFLTPLMFMAYKKLSASRSSSSSELGNDTIEAAGHKVILAGFGRTGTDLGRFLISAGVKPVIIDHDAANVDVLRRFGFEVYYGDASQLSLLEAAGAEEAELVVVTIGDVEKASALIHLLAKHYPHIKVAVSADDRSSAYELMDLGVDAIRRETFHSSIELGKDVLQLLGKEPFEAHRLMNLFKKHDQETLPQLHQMHREDEANYISLYQKHSSELEELMTLDAESETDEVDKAWTAANPEN